jgi:hypothetical protein
VPRYGRVPENEKVELWRYSAYNLEGSVSIWVLPTILWGVYILVMFDWRSHFELRPDFLGCQSWGGPAISYTTVAKSLQKKSARSKKASSTLIQI